MNLPPCLEEFCMPKQVHEPLDEYIPCIFLHSYQGHWPTSPVLFLEHPAKGRNQNHKLPNYIDQLTDHSSIAREMLLQRHHQEHPWRDTALGVSVRFDGSLVLGDLRIKIELENTNHNKSRCPSGRLTNGYLNESQKSIVGASNNSHSL